MRRIIEDETKTAVFKVDVTESNVSVQVRSKENLRPVQNFDLAPADAEHLMGLLSEALYGMRRGR